MELLKEIIRSITGGRKKWCHKDIFHNGDVPLLMIGEKYQSIALYPNARLPINSSSQSNI